MKKSVVLFFVLLLALTGCKKDDPDPPVASFDAPIMAYVTQPVEFTFTGSGASSYDWNFGEGSSLEKNPIFAFPTQGTKNIVLKVKGDGGSDVCDRQIAIKDGYASFDVKNYSFPMMSMFATMYFDGNDILDMKTYFDFSPGSITPETMTYRPTVWAGGQIGGITFVFFYQWKVLTHQFNHYGIYDTSTIYVGKSFATIDWTTKHKLSDIIP